MASHSSHVASNICPALGIGSAHRGVGGVGFTAAQFRRGSFHRFSTAAAGEDDHDPPAATSAAAAPDDDETLTVGWSKYISHRVIHHNVYWCSPRRPPHSAAVLASSFTT